MKMCRNILIIFIVLFSRFTFGQKIQIKPQVLIDLRRIDSLYRQLDKDPFNSLDIKYKKDDIKLTHFPYPNSSDSTILDAYLTTSIVDSLAIREYCILVKSKFSIVKPLLDLMIKNKFTSLSLSGPDECLDCSTNIYFGKQNAYIIKNLNSPCFSEQCYHPYSNKIKTKQITKDISITNNAP